MRCSATAHNNAKLVLIESSLQLYLVIPVEIHYKRVPYALYLELGEDLLLFLTLSHLISIYFIFFVRKISSEVVLDCQLLTFNLLPGLKLLRMLHVVFSGTDGHLHVADDLI